MKKENGKVLTGCILSGLAFLGLFLPSFTTYEVNVSYYGNVSEETLSYSPFAMMVDEDYAFVFLFILPIIVGLVLNLIFTLTHKNKQISLGKVLTPGILIVAGYFLLMIVGIVGAIEETYSDCVGTSTGFWPFSLVTGAFVANILLARASNKEIGPMIVNGQSVGQPASQPYQYTAPAQAAAPIQAAAPSQPATAGVDGKVYGNLQGAQRILDVYEDKIVLTQMKNFRALLTQDLFKGEKEIAFAMMSSIQYKPASKMILGYIQFEVPGVATGNNFGSENSWTFDESLNGIAKEVADYCKKQVVEAHKPKVAQVVQQTSAADELLKYKQLLDAGVITQEEFDAKKKELLGL